MRAFDPPPLDPAECVRLHNAGFHRAVTRLIATSTVRERVHARNHWVAHARSLIAGDPRRAAGQLHARLVVLARRFQATHEAMPIDVSTVEGACRAVLLLSGWQCLHRSTLVRACQRA